MKHSELAAMIEPSVQGSPLLKGRSLQVPMSRLQKLESLGPEVWIKRDDELSCSIAGSKLRKLWSLSQAWKLQRIENIVAWGSQRSAFLFALLQVARELQCRVELFLLQSSSWQSQGADGLFRVLLEGQAVHWVDRSSWSHVAELAERRAKELESSGQPSVLLAEGGEEFSSLAGAMTLGLEIVRQREELSLGFEEICIEAGSGQTAQALICALALMNQSIPVEVLLCAGDEQSFAQGLQRRQEECFRLLGSRPDSYPYRVQYPASARSFGSTNQSIFATIRKVARAEGLWLDPLYGAKLWQWFESRQERPKSSLLVHTGGALNVLNFAEFFRDQTEKLNR